MLRGPFIPVFESAGSGGIRQVIDLNCDMGEGMAHDGEIMPFISSVNIACGAHAGDEATMRRTVQLALEYRVAIGAHPSYPDRENFGRLDLLEDVEQRASGSGSPAPMIPIAALPALLIDQFRILQNICNEYGAQLHHVKPHGALYNRAARDVSVCAMLCETIMLFDPTLLLYGLSGSAMQREAERCGLRFVPEVFADRSYRQDGSLTPRSETGALIEDPELAVRQVLGIIREGRASAISGVAVSLDAGTVCIHSDGSHAVKHARAIHEALVKRGVSLQAP